MLPETILQKYGIRRIDGRTLKIIAAVCMVIDHIGLIFSPEVMLFRVIGRLSFPLFAFLLVEGFFKSRNLKGYFIRIAVFALISEVPYDYGFSGKLLDIGSQNVMLTLLVGLAMMYLLENPIRNLDLPDVIYMCIVCVVAASAAELLKMDYGFIGIAVILIFFFARKYPGLHPELLLIPVFAGSGWLQAFGILALIPIYLYNGERGYQPLGFKIGIYALYPAHILLLGLVHAML